MIKFNDGSILTGYIKQLLSSFNLPTTNIYPKTKETTIYTETTSTREGTTLTLKNSQDVSSLSEPLIENALYIKDGYIMKCVKQTGGSLVLTDVKQLDELGKILSDTTPYEYGKKIKGMTKSLKITNNLYDSYTHTYLGEYLRFQRDYNNINLLSLYNCFSNETAYNLNIKQIIQTSPEVDAVNLNFNTLDTKYTIYKIPVKAFQNYTIALTCNTQVEVVCGVESNKIPAGLYAKTYQKWRGLNFNHPVLYSRLANLTLEDLADQDKNLILYLKVPYQTKTSIVILEGNYLDFNDSLYYTKNNEADSSELYQSFYKKQNQEITNYEKGYQKRTNFDAFKSISALQLLSFNSGYSYPFADRLIEYLVDNVITPIDTISNNIVKMQKVLQERYTIDYTNEVHRHYLWLKQKGMSEQEYRKIRPEVGLKQILYKGIWEDCYRPILYDLSRQEGLFGVGSCKDLLGYVDKNVESILVAEKLNSKGLVETTTIDTEEENK